MRYVSIDLSSDNHLQQPQIFGGYAGEHNETILQVKLPPRLIDGEYSGYYFDFQTSEDNKISSPLIPVSELNDGVLSFYLTEQLTVAGKLLFNIIATLSNENTVSLISKTNTVVLYIGDSPEGNITLIDPNGYKNELLQMIDERILEIDPAEVDQTYNAESKKAQSGVAIAGAFVTKMDKFGEVNITDNGTDKYLIVDLYEYEISTIKGLSGLRLQSDGFISLDSGMVSIERGTLIAPTGSVSFYDSYGLTNLATIKIAEPVDDNDATNKLYVDNLVGNINSVLATIVDGVEDV